MLNDLDGDLLTSLAHWRMNDVSFHLLESAGVRLRGTVNVLGDVDSGLVNGGSWGRGQGDGGSWLRN